MFEFRLVQVVIFKIILPIDFQKSKRELSRKSGTFYM